MKSKRPAEATDESTFLRVFQILEQEQKERQTGQLHQAVASVGKAVSCKRWQNRILNVGPAHLLQSAAVQKQVAFLAERLEIEYVRLWSLFSPQMLLGGGGEKHFNFAFLDGSWTSAWTTG